MKSEVTILLVEDSQTDRELISEALKDTKLKHILRVAVDGEEALLFLQTERPDLILLDLNLPKKSGFEVLKTMKQDPALRAIPVIVLTNSTAPSDVESCYASCANAYVRKPLGFDGFVDVFRTTARFWFQVATLPVEIPSRISQAVSVPPSFPPDSE